jgi:hypothetical protein
MARKYGPVNRQCVPPSGVQGAGCPHASATIQITIRAGVATNSPASMAHVGSHHPNRLVRTLPSQSAADFVVTFVITSYPAQRLVGAPLVRRSTPITTDNASTA